MDKDATAALLKYLTGDDLLRNANESDTNDRRTSTTVMRVCCCWKAEGKISSDLFLKRSSSSAYVMRFFMVFCADIGNV